MIQKHLQNIQILPRTFTMMLMIETQIEKQTFLSCLMIADINTNKNFKP